MKGTLLLAVILGLLQYGSGALYGLVTGGGGGGTRTILETVQIDPTTGNFTLLVQNIIYVGASGTYDGISAFDQTHQNYYYATDFTTSFVFGVAVATNKLLPPISINANHITSIERDNVNAQLLITGIYQDGSEAIITFPDNNGKTEILINFTTQGIPSVYSTAIDNVNAVFYFSYFDNTAQVYNLASFAIKNPAQITTNKLSCGNLLAANHFFYDSTLSKIAGIGFDITAKVFNYFEVVAGACTTKALGLTGVVTSATYDPTASTLYFGFVGTNTVLYSFNTKTYTLSKVTVAAVLSDVQVSYKV